MDTINSVLGLIVSLAYLSGLCMALSGLYMFRRASKGEPGATNREAAQLFLVGCLLLILPTVYSVIKATTIDPSWSGDGLNALAIDENIDVDGINGGSFFGKYIPAESMRLLVGFVYIIGLLAFVRGVALLRHLGLASSAHNQGGAKKPLTHMAGGVLVMNITTVGCWVFNAIGISMLCGGS